MMNVDSRQLAQGHVDVVWAQITSLHFTSHAKLGLAEFFL